MTLFLISWFAFGYSFPLTVNFGVRHAVASRRQDVDRMLAVPGVYFPTVSLIKNGRLKGPLPLSLHVEE